MFVLNITDDYDNITFSNCTNSENDDKDSNFKFLLLSKPSSELLVSLRILRIYTLFKPLITNE